jgi:hypothetical protein
VRFNSAPSTNIRYKTIGEHASGSYSFIQGLHVPNNWSVSANAGLFPALSYCSSIVVMWLPHRNLDESSPYFPVSR